jgi:hypothetical protein
MDERFPTCAPVVLALLLTASLACDSTTGLTEPARAGAALRSSFTAEPLVVRPEFLPDSLCTRRSAFGVRINVIVAPGEDLILRGLRFAFVDRFGDRALPDVFPTPQGSFIPASLPVPFPGVAPLPSRAPIPIPGSPPIEGLLVSARTARDLAFFLRFGCGVFPEGIILIEGELNDRNGRPENAELRVTVRQ